MSIIFIGGTDTNIGKTVITSLLARYLEKNNVPAVTQKWVQTGIEDDLLMHDRFLTHKVYHPYRKPYHFNYPASPHFAAQLENKIIDPNFLIKTTLKLEYLFENVIIEGSGGLFVPLTNKITKIDVMSKMNCKCILVFNNKLGAINQTMMSVKLLESYNIELLGLIANQSTTDTPVNILENNVSTIKELSNADILGDLKFEDNITKSMTYFDKIGDQILSKLKNACIKQQ